MASQAQHVRSNISKYQARAQAAIVEAHPAIKSLLGFFRKFGNDWATTFAGALAYTLITALLPITLALVAGAGFIIYAILNNPDGTKAVYDTIGNIPGLESLKDSLQSSVAVRLSVEAGPLALISVLTAIFGGSRLFVAMEGSMNIIYRVQPRRPLRQNVVAIIMMVIFTILTPIMIFASTLPTALLNLISNNSALKKISFLATFASNSATILIASYLGALIVGFILFLAIYMVVPNLRITFAKSWPGAIVAAILLVALVSLCPILANKLMTSYVGQIGLILALVAFFYYFAVILMLGAEVNAYFFEKIPPLPQNLAASISTIGATSNRDQPLPKEEAKQHKESSTLAAMDKAPIAPVHTEEELTNLQEEHKQRQRNKDKDKKDIEQIHDQKKRNNRLTTTISVVAGSLLAMVIQLLRQHESK
jgi:Predicted membrane protein